MMVDDDVSRAQRGTATRTGHHDDDENDDGNSDVLISE